MEWVLTIGEDFKSELSCPIRFIECASWCKVPTILFNVVRNILECVAQFDEDRTKLCHEYSARDWICYASLNKTMASPLLLCLPSMIINSWNIKKSPVFEALSGVMSWNAFRFTGPWWGEPAAIGGFLYKRRVLRSSTLTEQTVVQIVELSVILCTTWGECYEKGLIDNCCDVA